jgi:hypothetical protein
LVSDTSPGDGKIDDLFFQCTELAHGVPDSDEERDPGEAVQGVEEDDEAPEPEADLQQEDVLRASSCAPAAIQTMLPRENLLKQKRKPNTLKRIRV